MCIDINKENEITNWSFHLTKIKCSLIVENKHIDALLTRKSNTRITSRILKPIKEYVEDLDKWEERKLVGKFLSINDLKFKVIKEIPRCSATNIKPKTSDVNLNIPFNLKKIYNHINLGIYLDPLNDGKINKGDLIKINE